MPNLPITETDVYTSLGTSSTNRVKTTFDSYGNTTSVVAYDFGATIPTTQTFKSYGQSWNGTSCSVYPSGKYIYNTPCYSHTENSSNVDVAKTQVTYSNTGHPTSTSRWVSGSNSLTTLAGYATNGTLTSVTDVNGAVTQYNNGPGVGACGGLLPVKTTYPSVNSVQLATSFTWDCNGGVLKSVTDVNNNTTTTYKYVNASNVPDPLWRLVSTQRPDGGSTTTTYNTGTSFPWDIQMSTTIVGTTNTKNEVKYDGLGRPVSTILTSDPAGNDEVDTAYDNMGRVASVTTPYRGASTGATSYTYDALGRYTRITNPDSTSRTFARTNRATNVTDETGVQTIQQIDGLGRLKYLCSGIGASTQANGQDPTLCTGVDGGPYGFLATYGYDALENLLTVNYSGELRTYTYDGVSRLTQSVDPESGTVSYTYDTVRAGDFYRKTLNSGKTITYSWD